MWLRRFFRHPILPASIARKRLGLAKATVQRYVDRYLLCDFEGKRFAKEKLMPAINVERSVRINAPRSKVRSAIDNFAEWPKWSPWLCMEPSANVNVFGTAGQIGHGYDWKGELVGAGGMKLAGKSDNHVDMDLEFLKPFKSKAKVKMTIKSVNDDETDVIWHMNSKLPFFLFFMVGMMKRMIGMDYTRGLKMLKEYVETGDVPSETKIIGIVDVPAMDYVGVDGECAMNNIGESMDEKMCELQKAVASLDKQGPPGAVYRDVDLKNQHCDYTVFVPVKAAQGAGGAGNIKPCKAIKIIHQGSYRHLGNAWSTAMSYQRYKKLKPLKAQPCFEVYSSDPESTPEKEIVTEIYIPIRS